MDKYYGIFEKINKYNVENIIEETNYMLFKEALMIKDSSFNANKTYYDLIINNIDRAYKSLNNNKKILLAGEVQSGKTENIIGFLSKAMDNEWDIIICMGGTTKTLLNQFLDRFENNKYKSKFSVYSSVTSETPIHHELAHKKKMLFNILKGQEYIKIIYQKILELGDENINILIVDDECDFMTLPTGKNNTLTYDSFKNLMLFQNCKYVGITATPYANILNNFSDSIYPDEIINLCSTNRYTGLSFFKDNKAIKILENKSWKNEKHLQSALQIFVNDCFIKMAYLDKNGIIESQHLINIDLKTKGQNKIFARVNDHIKILIEEVLNKNEILFNDYIKKYNISFHDLYLFTKKVQSNEKIIISTLNSKTDSIKLINNSKEKHSFYIGGVLLSRGITYENLYSELMLNIRNVTNVNKQPIDIFLQRSRWFGYRSKNIFANITQIQLMDIYISTEVSYIIDECYKVNKYFYSMLETELSVNEIKENLKNLKNELEYVKYSDKE